ncbi:MAG: hypothetical protein VX738_07025 [Planctomycetota bacterium]|nr:hypothetical protein [Planctomycetota bacterium]
MNPPPRIQVIKVGGSLLANRTALLFAHNWIQQQTNTLNVVITGGGHAVQSLRDWQIPFYLADSDCHHNALQMMSLTLSQLAVRWNGLSRISEFTELQKFAKTCQPVTVLFDSRSFIQNPPTTLKGSEPHANWDSTSDSIAAALCRALHGTRLALLKSAPAPTSNLEHLAFTNYVDRDFPRMAAPIKSITFVDCCPR